MAISKCSTQAHQLQSGDQLCSHDNQIVAVEKVSDTNGYTTVYNLRVEDHHTYFVADEGWSFSVWAHNVCDAVLLEADGQHHLIDVQTGRTLTTGTETEVRAFATSGGHTILAGTTKNPAPGYAGYAPRPQTVASTFDAEAALPGPLGTCPVGARGTGSTQTTGVATWTDATGRQSMTLTSGQGNTIVPQSAYGTTPVPGMTKQNHHHAEGQMAYFMRQNPHIREAEMWINHPNGPCGTGLPGSLGCDPNLKQTLFPGQKLTIRWRDTAGQPQVHVFEGPLLP